MLVKLFPTPNKTICTFHLRSAAPSQSFPLKNKRSTKWVDHCCKDEGRLVYLLLLKSRVYLDGRSYTAPAQPCSVASKLKQAHNEK